MPKVDLPLKQTKYQRHVAAWKDCTRCTLSHARQRVVFARGQVPADVVFLGEAPGSSEDALGIPFRGPAGHLLDGIAASAFGPVQDDRQADGRDPLRWCFYNLVGCIPVDDEGAKGSPEPPEIKACRPRLEEFLAIARPKLVVLVGALAEKHAGWLTGVKTVAIRHPAWILGHCPYVQQQQEVDRATVIVGTAAEGIP